MARVENQSRWQQQNKSHSFRDVTSTVEQKNKSLTTFIFVWFSCPSTILLTRVRHKALWMLVSVLWFGNDGDGTISPPRGTNQYFQASWMETLWSADDLCVLCVERNSQGWKCTQHFSVVEVLMCLPCLVSPRGVSCDCTWANLGHHYISELQHSGEIIMTALFKCKIRSPINIYLKSSLWGSALISFTSSTVTPSAWDNRRCFISPNIIFLHSVKNAVLSISSAPLEGKVAAAAPAVLHPGLTFSKCLVNLTVAQTCLQENGKTTMCVCYFQYL